MQDTLDKLELVLPRVFKGVSILHEQERYQQTRAHNLSTMALTKQAMKKLKDMLSVEYEFYEFASKKLDR